MYLVLLYCGAIPYFKDRQIDSNFKQKNKNKIKKGLEKLESRGIEMKAGSISFHNGHTIHGAGANMTNMKRRAMSFQLMPNNSIWNGKQNILTQKQIESMKIGQLLNDDSQNPLLFP